MEDFELEEPIYENTGTKVSICRAYWKTRDMEVVVKRYDCSTNRMKLMLEKVNDRINEGLLQARVDHEFSLPIHKIILEVPQRKDSEKESFIVNHIIESMEKDVLKDIEDRAGRKEEYSEEELWNFLDQIGSAVLHAHNKAIFTQKIAHRDIKPANILMKANTFKLADFGCVWERKDKVMTVSAAGSIPYMSPQLRMACLGFDGSYNAYLTDVFALGACLLHMAGFELPCYLCELTKFDEGVRQKVGSLRYSEKLKNMLCGMLRYEEKERLNLDAVMKEVKKVIMEISLLRETECSFRDCETLSTEATETQISSSETLFVLSPTTVSNFDIEQKTWITSFLNRTIVCDDSSRYTAVGADKVFCCGAGPSKNDVENLMSSAQAEQDVAYLVHVRKAGESEVQVLPRMISRRILPGLILHEDSVYVFGGGINQAVNCMFHSVWGEADIFGGDSITPSSTPELLKSGETFALLSRPSSWSALSCEMTDGRFAFTPCLHDRNIYLCGGFGSSTIETYNLDSCTFEFVAHMQEQSSTVAWIDKSSICIISNRHYTEFNLQGEKKIELQRPQQTFWPNSNPVIGKAGDVISFAAMGSNVAVWHKRPNGQLDLYSMQVSLRGDQ